MELLDIGTTVTPIQLKRILCKTLPARIPVMIAGKPGIGKSDILKQVVATIGCSYSESHPVCDSPIDYKGLGFCVDGKATFLPFDVMYDLCNVKENKLHIHVFEDVGQSSQSIQAAMMQVILARRINKNIISDSVVFVCLTNRREDKAGVSAILEPLKSRHASILTLQTTFADWKVWALENDINEMVLAYLETMPSSLDKFLPTTDMVNSPSPRTWYNLSRLLNIGVCEFPVICGAIGKEEGVAFTSFMSVYSKMVSLETILSSPDTAEIPNDISARIAIVNMLVYNMSKTNVRPILTYFCRLPSEDRNLGLYNAQIRFPYCMEVREFALLVSKNNVIYSA
jgi:hypothetical protein